ncbi:uncharacterized protein LOC132741266 [Ruditapes philippinarum]|uniref:uncharacterized protein LOC132741266 n=1 Tax=Ruditapes philippinarum TaxID=129788 RepID=UPI00295AC930|nr:uncharacterized protein LOC132741266 [Ruditapes philippinarum]
MTTGDQSMDEHDIMDRIEDLMSSKLASMEERILKSQKAISDTQISKIQQDILQNDNYVFKRKSCEDQLKFNVKVSNALKETASKVNEMDLSGASECISEGLSLLSNRQKLIRIADSSELGWLVVKEYQSNPLASDSEDEKKLARAEARANRKWKSKRPFSDFKRFSPYGHTASVETQPQKSVAAWNNISTVTTSRSTRPGLCFACGKPGHWKYECRRTSADKTNEKIKWIPRENNFVADEFSRIGLKRNITEQLPEAGCYDQSMVDKSSKRTAKTPTQKKDPVSTELIVELCDKIQNVS